MVPRPVAVGLNLCDYVLVEEGTRKVSLIGCLTQWTVRDFPFMAPPFFVHTVLTDCLGEANLSFIVTKLDTDEEVYQRRVRVRFTDRLRQMHLYFRVTDCTFPAAGAYLCTLLVDGEWVAQRRLAVRTS